MCFPSKDRAISRRTAASCLRHRYAAVQIDILNGIQQGDTIGQAFTFPFFLAKNDNATVQPLPARGQDQGYPYVLYKESMMLEWTYRRSRAQLVNQSSFWHINTDETSQINIGDGGNDYTQRYLFQPLETVYESIAKGDFCGFIAFTFSVHLLFYCIWLFIAFTFSLHLPFHCI